MTETFTVGDVVALNSGGHPMTVHGHNPDDPKTVHVSWIDEAGQYRDGWFFAACVARTERRRVHIDEGMVRWVWVFAATGQPIADHIAVRA